MQGDIESPMYQNWQFILSAMQGDIECIDMKSIIYKISFSNARWHRQSNLPKSYFISY